MKRFSLLVLLCFLSSVLLAYKPMSVPDRVRLLARVLNHVDTVIDYSPYREGRAGHIGVPVLVGDNFFIDKEVQQAVVSASLALVRGYVLSDSSKYYAHYTLYFIAVNRSDRSFKLDYNDSGMYYSKRALPLEQRYELLSALMDRDHWLLRSLTGEYADRRLGYELSDEVDGVKLSDRAMNSYAIDLGQLVYEFVLDRNKKIVATIPISFTDMRHNKGGYHSTVYYRLFCMADARADSAFAFR